jgi:glycosyltransferase involved in cell wall biosynthesis
MKKVLVYKSEVLHFSETFIREQLLAYTEWTPVLAARRRVEGVSLDGLQVRIVGDAPRTGIGSAYDRALKLMKFASPRIVRELEAEQPDLLHVHFGPDAVDFWPIAKRLARPLLVTLHGYDITVHRDRWEQGDHGTERRLYPRRLVAMSQSPQVHFVAVSEAMRQCALDFGIAPERLSVSYIGIDRTEFANTGKPMRERARRVVFVGRLVEKKGVRYLIEAFARVRERVLDAELVIVGDGPLRDELGVLAEQLRVPVEFVGKQTPAEVRGHLNEARLFCLPSVTADNGDAEGFGLVLLEAQACGVPVVTSARGGAEEGLVADVTGVPFAERDVEALTEHLASLLADDARLERMSRAAEQFVADRFDLKICTRGLEHLYDDVVSGRTERVSPATRSRATTRPIPNA